jgi:hypothetical protein
MHQQYWEDLERSLHIQSAVINNNTNTQIHHHPERLHVLLPMTFLTHQWKYSYLHDEL